MESVLSRGVLVASDPIRGKVSQLDEVNLFTSEMVHSFDSGSYEFVNGLSLSHDDIEKLTSQILSTLLQKSGLSFGEIDSLSAYSDAFVRFDDPREETKLIQEILESCRNQFGGNPTILKPEEPKIAANEPKSKMVAAGANVMLNSRTDLEVKPDIYLDLSTCFSGLAYSPGSNRNIEVLISGLGSAILDALARGHRDLNLKFNSTLQMPDPSGETYGEESSRLASQVAEETTIRRVSSGTRKIGHVPVDVSESYDEKIKLVGCDIGKNGSDLEKITELGREASSYGTATIQKVIDLSFARMIGKMIRTLYEEEIIETDGGLCVSGRKNFSKAKRENTLSLLTEMGFKKIAENTVFVNKPTSYYGVANA